MNTNDTLVIDALTYGQDAIARTSDGLAVFVEGGAPGDIVEVEYTEKHANFAKARVINIREAGSVRVPIPNELAQVAFAAPWAHIAYEHQLIAKRTNIVEALVRIAKQDRAQAESCVEECAASPHTLHYRNKVEYACDTDAQGRLVVGLTNASDDTVVPIESFALAHKAIARAARKIQGALRYMEGGQPGRLGIHRIGVRHSTHTGACEIALWTTPASFPRKDVARTLGEALDTSSIVRVLADAGHARKIKGVECLSGAGYWHEKLAAFDYRVSAPSFFQVNTEQAQTLVHTVAQGLHVREGMRVADLYCGVGTFSLPLANLGCDCIAVESAGSAVRDLRRNADEAGLWLDIIGGDTARELPELGALDALVVDPPRAGLAEGVAESIAAASPKRLAYVSCDPSTWARDVARLANCGYSLERVRPVDLFPHTYHCELVSFFAKEK